MIVQTLIYQASKIKKQTKDNDIVAYLESLSVFSKTIKKNVFVITTLGILQYYLRGYNIISCNWIGENYRLTIVIND